MPIPDYQTLMRPVLQAISLGETRVIDILPKLISEFDLTQEEVETTIPSGTQPLIANRAHWARTYLSKAGLLSSPKRGTHKITEKGREYLKRFPDRIDNAVLLNSSSFEDWRASSAPPSQEAHKHVYGSLPTDETPEDRMISAFADVETTLISDVIEAVLSLSPARFESW